MSENLEYWDKMRTPPKAALKKITAGRLKGMNDINPQWRLQVMTETFGPVGFGWKYSIDKLWLEPGDNNQVCAFALVSVQTIKDGVWSEPVPGVGGSMLVTKESKGLYTSDEAYKMAITDALSVAFKAFGLAADIYMGIMDGSKYADPPKSNTVPQKTSGDWIPEIDKFDFQGKPENYKKWFHDREKEMKALSKPERTKVWNYLMQLCDAMMNDTQKIKGCPKEDGAEVFNSYCLETCSESERKTCAARDGGDIGK